MCARTRTFTAATTTAAVPAARHRARADLTSCGVDPDHPILDTALLIVSELVTNSVVHGAEHSSHFAVTVTVDDHTLLISVHDRHPHLPGPRTPVSDHEECSGRGLRLVAQLSAEAGGMAETTADADGGGKSICVTIPLPADARREIGVHPAEEEDLLPRAVIRESPSL